MALGALRGRRADAAALLAFALLSIAMTWPLAAHMGRQVPGDPHDTLYTLYALSWSYKALAGGGAYWDASIFYPHRGVLAYGDPLLGLTLLGAPIRLLTSNLVLVFNILFLLSFWLCAAGAYALAKRLTGARPAAFLAGLIFAFCPYRFAHISHLEILFFAWIPFTLLFMDRFFEKPTWPHAAGVAASYVLQVLCCAYYGAFFTVAAALLALAEVIRTKLWRQGRFWIRAVAIVGAAAACLGPYILPFLRIHERMMFLRPRWEVLHYSAQLQHYLAVPPWNRLWGRLLGGLGGVEWQHFPGLAALALTAWGWIELRRRASQVALPDRVGGPRILYGLWDGFNIVLAGWTVFLAFSPGFSASLAGIKVVGRRIEDPLSLLLLSLAARAALDPRLRDRLARLVRAAPRPARAYAAIGGLAFLLSLGPSIRLFDRKILTGPYEWLYDRVPGFQGLRASNRFSILVVLTLAVFAAYAAAHGLRKAKGRGGRIGWAAGLAAWILIESWAVPLPLSRIPGPREIPAIYQSVSALPAGASLVEVPMPSADSEEFREAWPVYYSSFHGRKLVNGYSGYAPPAYRVVREAMGRLPDRPVFDLLERLGVDYLLAHIGKMPEASREDFLRTMLRHRHRADPVAEADGSVLYRILPWAEAHVEPETATRRVGDKGLWRGRAGRNPDSIGRAFDGRADTLWTNGYPQEPGESLEIDLGREERFSRIELRQGEAPLAYPRSFRVEASVDGREWALLDEGRGFFPALDRAAVEDWRSYRSVVSRVPCTARFLRIVLTETHAGRYPWSVAEIDLYSD
jgi:hypothetical protein